jgi:hypothetical protein
MDTNTSRYWTICVITLTLKGYAETQSEAAKTFFENEFPELSTKETLLKRQNKYIQEHLWQICHNYSLDLKQRALALLCMRCYVSHPIVKHCQIIANKNSNIPNLFADLLPYVLNDDGKTLIVVDSDNKTQLKLNENSETQLIKGKFFNVEILKTFNPSLPNNKASESLDNWSMRLTQQNDDLQNFLLENRIWIPSDWSLLCKDISKKLHSDFIDGDRYCIEVFHDIYRRDRLKSCQGGRYSKPTDGQLEKMRRLLRDRKIIFDSNEQLAEYLRKIAEILRNNDYHIITGTPKAIPIESVLQHENDNSFSSLDELYANNPNSEDFEEAESRSLLNELPIQVLPQAIPLGVSRSVDFLKKSRNYSAYAQKFTEGVQLYYRINNPLSLKEIAEQWKISWAKARRIFKFHEFIENIESLSVEIGMGIIKQSNCFENEISCNPNELQKIAQELRSYLFERIFRDAFAELTASRQTYKNSLFAQLLRQYISDKRDITSIEILKKSTINEHTNKY